MQSASNAEICQALKLALKSKGITYRQVAERIGVSEKTIKRLFKEQDCTLSRLNQICQAIDISIYELIDFSRHYAEPLTKLANEQEVFLSNNENHFAFLFFLILGNSPEEIQKKYQMSDQSVFRYLRDLDRQGFIELREHNRYRLLVEGKLLMRLHGPLHELVRKANSVFLNYSLDNDDRPDTQFISSFRYMSRESLKSLLVELEAITEKYRKIAHQNEMILPKKQLLPVKWTSMASEFDVCGIWELHEHPETLAEEKHVDARGKYLESVI